MSNNPHNEQATNIKNCYDQVLLEQVTLCDILEDIADSLPHNVDKQLCLHTAKMLPPLIKRAHKIEQETLFPLLENSKECAVDLSATVKRLKAQHIRDEYNAEELAEILLSYGKGEPSHGAETTGYAIRGFFETLRRHIAFIEELISPALERAKKNNNS